MNTIAIPAPIIRECRVSLIDGTEINIKKPPQGDSYNLSTGEVSVARVIGGIRYDTVRASLVVGAGEFYGYCSYKLCRLYRTADGKFFTAQMQWSSDEGFIDLMPILVLEETNVLTVAKNLLAKDDITQFLRDWYCSGLLPLDDGFVQNWAETILSADECEAVLAALGGRYSTQAGSIASATG
jgi:hypothetical protein